MDEALSLQGKTALICEDEALFVLMLQQSLPRLGMQVIGATRSGEEAVTCALEKWPEIVLLDLRLPDMNGLEVARRILAAYPACVIIITGTTDAETEQRARSVGACGFVTKPITSEQLPAILSQALETYSLIYRETEPR